MMLKPIFHLLTFLVTSSSSLALAGGMTGSGGGGHITFEANPWFIGDDAVPYCIEIGSNFSGKDIAPDVINEALQNWTKAIDQLQPVEVATVNDRLSNGEWQERPVSLPLARKFVQVPCNWNPELTFAFGVRNDVIKNILQAYPDATVGFAEKTSYDIATRRAKGIIWLVEDSGTKRYQSQLFLAQKNPLPGFWAQRPILLSALMHELGHIFGFTHQHGGLMDALYPSMIVGGYANDPSVNYLLKLRPTDLVKASWRTLGRRLCHTLNDRQDELKTLWHLKATPARLCFADPRIENEETADGLTIVRPLKIDVYAENQQLIRSLTMAIPSNIFFTQKTATIPVTVNFLEKVSDGVIDISHTIMKVESSYGFTGVLEDIGVVSSFVTQFGQSSKLLVHDGKGFIRISLTKGTIE